MIVLNTKMALFNIEEKKGRMKEKKLAKGTQTHEF